jgi:hypothetical protein
MSKSKELFMQVRETEMNEPDYWDARDADHFYYQFLNQTTEPK